MFDIRNVPLLEAVEMIVKNEPNLIANLANAASVVWMYTDRINWAGFYLSEDQTLVLGPFQGKPACVRIPFGNGVCGAAASKKETIVVNDVREFPGHIACDANSRSEIVVPMIGADGVVIGVLDVDSPEIGRFSEHDKICFESLVKLLLNEYNKNRI